MATRLCGVVRVDVGAFQQIVEPADPVPTVAIPFDQQSVPSASTGEAVISRKQIDKKLLVFLLNPTIRL
jgi:hypothetical protein